MKYLVYATPKASPTPVADPLATNKAAAAYLADLHKQGKMEVGYSLVTGGGFGVVEVASHAELAEIIFNYPLYDSFQWRAEPLTDFAQVFGTIIAALEKESGK